jgi:hypothetical protein
MSPSSEERMAYVPAELPWALRWVGTSNPFYVISAGLFLVGLWLSFGDPQQAEDTWVLMFGLAGYTLLLAFTGYLLIRFARVWDDARTVLLLVVLMFLAISVTFDRVIVFDVVEKRLPIRGFTCVLLGLLLAVAVSEAVLRGVRLSLPACYRAPYYLLLALFFLYPLALTPFLEDRHGAPMMWGLLGFATAAGLIFLTLLPALRLGAAAVARNGSPWPWPLYPWSLFGLFALAVPARAILLCYSMHLIDVNNLYDMTFAPYFLVPFALCLSVLLLEVGITTQRAGVLWTALAAPLGLIALAWVGQRSEPIYVKFLNMFTSQLGGDPVYWTIILIAGYHGYAALRRVPWAVEILDGGCARLDDRRSRSDEDGDRRGAAADAAHRRGDAAARPGDLAARLVALPVRRAGPDRRAHHDDRRRCPARPLPLVDGVSPRSAGAAADRGDL